MEGSHWEAPAAPVVHTEEAQGEPGLLLAEQALAAGAEPAGEEAQPTAGTAEQEAPEHADDEAATSAELGQQPGEPAAPPSAAASAAADILVVEHPAYDSADLAAVGGVLDLAAESSDLLEGSAAAGGLGLGAGEDNGLVETIKALRLGDEPAPTAGPPLPAAGAAKKVVSVAGRLSKLRLSFSAPPHIPRPKTAVRHNYSHSPQRVRQILRDNEALVKRLGEITYSGSRVETDMAKHDKLMATVAAGSVARRQVEAGRIVRQNLDIYKRLQAIKPSPEVRRSEHRKSFIKSRQYIANIAQTHQAGTAAEAWNSPRAARRRDPAVWADPE